MERSGGGIRGILIFEDDKEMFEVFFFYACLQLSGWWGIGAVVRDSNGLVLAAATWKIPGSDNVELAEAYGLLLTMRLARDCGFREVIFEGDNEKIWNMTRFGSKENRSYLGSVIQEIQRTQSYFAKCNFQFTHRDNNLVGHKLAHLALSDPGKVWIEEVPPLISEVYFHDLMN